MNRVIPAVLLAISLASACTGEEPPDPPATIETGSQLSGPSTSLRRELPEYMRGVVGDDLVLLFRRDDVYHSFHEGLFPHSCPMSLDEPDTYREILRRHRACVGTAVHRITPIDDAEPESESGSHNLKLADVRSGDQVIWRGIPKSGSIGIDSPDACARISRFAPDYACKDGEIRLVAQRV